MSTESGRNYLFQTPTNHDFTKDGDEHFEDKRRYPTG